MKRDENLIILRGTLGNDPESRQLPSQTLKTTFILATEEIIFDRATKQQTKRTTRHRIVAFGAVAEECQKLLKRGMRAYIKGSLSNWSKTDSQSGQKAEVVEVVAQEVEPLLGNATAREQADRRARNQAASPPASAGRQPARPTGPRHQDAPPTFNPYVPGDDPPFEDYPDDYRLP